MLLLLCSLLSVVVVFVAVCCCCDGGWGHPLLGVVSPPPPVGRRALGISPSPKEGDWGGGRATHPQGRGPQTSGSVRHHVRASQTLCLCVIWCLHVCVGITVSHIQLPPATSRNSCTASFLRRFSLQLTDGRKIGNMRLLFRQTALSA